MEREPRMRHRPAIWALLALVGLFVGAASGGRAEAAFPGANGKIVFGSQHAGEDEIWVMNADGSGKTNLTRHDGAKISDLDPSWSPDGRQIAFASDPGGNMQIWLMNADGSNPHQLTNAPPGRNRLPSWSADGKSIVFVSNSGGNAEIYRVRVSDGQLTNLTNDPAFDYSPAASSRGNKIVFSSDRDGNGHLYVLSGDGTLQRITNGPGYDYFPNWSPHGNDIVFTREEASGETELYIVHADGSGQRRLTNTAGLIEYFPAFAPDGTKVVYSSCTFVPGPLLPNLRCQVHTINLDGTGDTSLGFPPLSFPIFDDFNSDTRNVDMWSIIHDGNGGTLQWTNGRLEMSIAADASPTPGQSSIGAHVGANCLLNGDYVAQVDYQLIDWPVGDNVNVGLQAYPNQGAIHRSTQSVSLGTGIYDSYNGFVPPAAFASTTTTDQSGSLRLVRSGTTTTTYYKSGNDWVPFATDVATPTPAIILLSFKSFSDFGHQAAKVGFDNFSLTGTDVDCSDIRPNFHPDWAPTAKK